MAPTREIIAFLDRLLDAGAFEDYGPNGLQVPGAAEVTSVVTAVSSSLELFHRARDEGAELVLVHHGLFWNGGPLALSPAQAERLRVLLSTNLNLAAYHLPLDAHPEVGNNALLAKGLGAELTGPFGSHRGRAIGYETVFPGDGVPAAELVERIATLTGGQPLTFTEGPDVVRRMAIVSGGAAKDFPAAVHSGMDAFLTGEPSEPAMAEAREAGVHFFAAGHYATETFGVRRLGEEVAERFGVRHAFVDLPNPV